MPILQINSNLNKLRVQAKKGPDGLDYITVVTQETTREKIRRAATKLGETIDRVLFYSGDMSFPQQQKH